MGEVRSRPLRTLPSWSLQDAKARFSEVVRHARGGEPQRVTMRGEDAVVVVSADEYARLVPNEAAKTLYDLVMQTPPIEDDGEFNKILEEFRVRLPGRPPVNFND